MWVGNIGVFEFEEQLTRERRLTAEDDLAVGFGFGHGLAHQIHGGEAGEKDEELVGGNKVNERRGLRWR